MKGETVITLLTGCPEQIAFERQLRKQKVKFEKQEYFFRDHFTKYSFKTVDLERINAIIDNLNSNYEKNYKSTKKEKAFDGVMKVMVYSLILIFIIFILFVILEVFFGVQLINPYKK